MKTCYRCDEPATGVEHVPPRCIFPEAKDLDGEDYRISLITVPSCDEHNLAKSKDDEFLMVALASLVGNNSIAYRHLTSKVTRAMEHTDFRLLDAVVGEPRSIFAVDPEGVTMRVIVGKADLVRLDSIFEAIALGIFFEEFRRRFRGSSLAVVPMFLTYQSSDDTKESAGEALKREIKPLLERENAKTWPKKGANPEVFYYQFGPPDLFGCILLRLCFFEWAEVLCSFVPQGVNFVQSRTVPVGEPSAGADG